ncbi:MAG: rhomboid family intramembrane serine protease [Haloarculaceae archaeon]
MAPSVPVELIERLSPFAIVAALALSAFVLRGRDGRTRPLDPLRERFVLGVPWGTVLSVLGVLAVYFFLQGGGQQGGPVVVGFRSWSFGYPLGMVTAAFSHANEGHITGNLLGTVVFAPIAEFAWSHYPTRRGSHSFGNWLTNPFVRILLFVVGVFLVGLATSLFTPGALIGFSGVVFAFGGFAIVTRPITAVYALVAERVVSLSYYAFQNPLIVARGRTQFVTPGWADIAIQGHALGLLVGVLGGLWLVRTRDAWPGYRRVYFATLVFAVAKSLYAFYWYLSNTEYVLFRGLGTATMFLLAGVVALALAARDRTLVPRIDLSRREAAVGVLLCVVLALSLVAIPYNLVSIDAGPESDSGVEIRDYTVTYAEQVPNQYIAGVQIPGLRDSLTVNTSGVIVTSERRNVWEAVVPAGRLQSRGSVRVPVGGVGWRETVVVSRSGWSVVDGGSTYKVFVDPPEDDATQVFEADPVRVPAVLNGSRVTLAPVDNGYQLAVSENNTTVATGQLPQPDEQTTLGGITFERNGTNLNASVGRTELRIAKRQQ